MVSLLKNSRQFFGCATSRNEMFSSTILKFHFSVFGVWESKGASSIYHVWQIVCLIVIGIGLPLSLFMSFIYIENREDAMKIPVLMCTMFSVSIKCVLIVVKKSKLNELLDILHEMDSCVDSETETIMQNAFRKCRHIHIAFTLCYYGAYIMVMMEFISNDGTNSFWQSTILWPWQWAHTPSLYHTILLLQMITNAINCMVAVLTDTFTSILCILLSGHLLVLERALQCLRMNETSTSPSNDVEELIKCIKYHDLCVQ